MYNTLEKVVFALKSYSLQVYRRPKTTYKIWVVFNIVMFRVQHELKETSRSTYLYNILVCKYWIDSSVNSQDNTSSTTSFKSINIFQAPSSPGIRLPIMAIATNGSFYRKFLLHRLWSVDLVWVLVWDWQNFLVQMLQGKEFQTDLLNTQRQLYGYHSKLKTVMQHINWETSDGMEILQIL